MVEHITFHLELEHRKFISFFKKMGQSRPLFVYYLYFLDTISITQIEKSVDGVLGIRTRGRRMAGADKTMELWRPHKIYFCFYFLVPVSFCKWAIPGLFFFIFVFSIVKSKHMLCIKFCRWLDSNSGPLISEASAQHLSHIHFSLYSCFFSNFCQWAI